MRDKYKFSIFEISHQTCVEMRGLKTSFGIKKKSLLIAFGYMIVWMLHVCGLMFDPWIYIYEKNY